MSDAAPSYGPAQPPRASARWTRKRLGRSRDASVACETPPLWARARGPLSAGPAARLRGGGALPTSPGEARVRLGCRPQPRTVPRTLGRPGPGPGTGLGGPILPGLSECFWNLEDGGNKYSAIE